MDDIDDLLVKVLARTLSIEAFEAKLYANQYVSENVLAEDKLLELLSINFKSTDPMLQILEFCHQNLDLDKCMLAIIEHHCRLFLLTLDPWRAEQMLFSIQSSFKWDYSHRLVSQVSMMGRTYNMGEASVINKEKFLDGFEAFSESLLDKLRGADLKKRLEVLYQGV